jgi:putative membrane protein
MNLSNLPLFNATLNSCSTIFLLAGLYFILKGKKDLHRYSMVAALIFSSLFLCSYLYYHYHKGHTLFWGTGWIKIVYFSILVPHVILAVVMLPFIFKTFLLAFKKRWEEHKRLARIAYPMWLFVSVSGVIVYFMLYEWKP